MAKRQNKSEEKVKLRKSPRLEKTSKVDELRQIIAADVFGRPTFVHFAVINYVVAMRLAPVPVEEDMVNYVRSIHPETEAAVLAGMWRRLKEYFSPENQDKLNHLTPMMDIPAMVEAFAGTAASNAEIPNLNLPPAQLLPIKSMAPQVPQQPQEPPEASCLSTDSIGAESSILRSSRSSRSSKSSNCKLTSSALLRLLAEFAENFKTFTGEPWVLSSGTVVDDVLSAWAQKLASEQLAESELHSFVIENVKEVLEAFEDEADKAEIRAVLEARPGEHLQDLNDSERAYLALFAKGPKEVGQLLDKSWTDISLHPQENNPDDDFRSFVHHWMKHLYLVYRTRNYQLPTTESESWFLNMLWGPLALILDTEEALQYKHAGYNSTSSTLRKNIDWERGQRQAVGRKADGMILGTSTGLEICVLEAEKKDNGPRSTKALGDTLKIAKLAKDMVDVMRANVPKAVHHQLVAYCFRLSAGSMHLYTFQQRSGRFDQLFYETSVAFPPRWDALTAEDITTVIGQVMALRKELVSYNNKLAIWKKGHKAAKESIKPAIPTLSTPASTPNNGPASV
ncbi:hypothetical protein EC957_010218 [Mortierella hygrophila]|uniref:Uncharacterized protein n=1 Tax=Mortierella hygrophila TaxID=979708 RepID=A0A9P6FAS2_9FUNG|nr:hypothetical protein EC957_010218 [Mortierella hygrophila]